MHVVDEAVEVDANDTVMDENVDMGNYVSSLEKRMSDDIHYDNLLVKRVLLLLEYLY
jgi:hypothetical protein